MCVWQKDLPDPSNFTVAVSGGRLVKYLLLLLGWAISGAAGGLGPLLLVLEFITSSSGPQ